MTFQPEGMAVGSAPCAENESCQKTVASFLGSDGAEKKGKDSVVDSDLMAKGGMTKDRR